MAIKESIGNYFPAKKALKGVVAANADMPKGLYGGE